jgi:hypothetical protein
MSTVLLVSQLRVNQLLGKKLREMRIDELYCSRGSRGSDLLSQIKRKLDNWSIPKELKCLLQNCNSFFWNCILRSKAEAHFWTWSRNSSSEKCVNDPTEEGNSQKTKENVLSKSKFCWFLKSWLLWQMAG